MNDKQIRLEILLDYYKAMRNGTGPPSQEDNEKLKGINGKDYDFNFGVLIKDDLIDGHINHADDGAEIYTPNGSIGIRGIRIVETFLDACIENTEKTIEKVFDKTLSYMNKIAELVTIWTTNLELYQQAWELLSSLIS